MTLSSILNAAAAGIANTEYRIGVTNSNIANANDPNYTTKSASTAPLTELLALSNATSTRAANTYLTNTVVASASNNGRDQSISDSLTNYDAALGSVSAGDDISSQLTGLQTALTSLTANGGTASDKAAVAASAQRLADGVRNLSGELQSLRGQANNDIATTVAEINATTTQIADLNKQILTGTANGSDITNLEDQRDAALQTLSKDIGITYYTTPTNQVQVYTAGGVELVGRNGNQLSYTAASSLTAAVTYPTSISGIIIDGQDITTSLKTGRLAGLVSLRDQTYPAEQAKLDAYAQTLINQANTASNAGTAYPPPSSLTGLTTVANTDPFSAIGTLRVAVTDKSGTVVSTQDIDLTTMIAVGDMVAALNAVPGLSASINAAGKLTVNTTNPNQGVALADIGAMVSPNGSGVSAFFGLNNLFAGTDSSNIQLNPSIATTPSNMPTSSLSKAAGLAAGQVGVASADTTTGDAIIQALSTPASIPAAGNFPAQTTSLQNYASNFVASAATTVSSAATQASTSKATFSAAQTQLQNLTSVNTDEQMAHLQAYQQQYQANAQLIATVRSLFNTLIQMMNG